MDYGCQVLKKRKWCKTKLRRPIEGALVTFKLYSAYINQHLWKCSIYPTDKESLILKLLNACKIHLRTTERWPCASHSVSMPESGTSLGVRLKRCPCSKPPIPACTNTLLREEFGGNRTDFSRAGCLSTQPFFCVAHLLRCWYVYEYTLRTLFANFAVSLFIYSCMSISIFIKVLATPYFYWHLDCGPFTK